MWADAVAAAGLSSAATLLQAAYSNDLMDPYLLGSLSGSLSLMALGVLLLGVYALASPHSYTLAFLGSLVPGLLVSAFALRAGPSGALMFGISLTLALQGLSSVLSYMASAVSGTPFLPLLLGTTQYATTETLTNSTLLISVSFIISVIMYRKISIMEYPSGFPRSFGIVEERALAISTFLASVSASATVACCGVLPFLGLMGALVGRRLSEVGTSTTLLVSFLASYIIMVLADTLSNSVETPYGYLPVGSVLSLIGGAALAAILVKRSREGYG
ncbi:MAG: iron ABC transporter permease [Crenarchaeota archaeon]|nr:iron ABC transporter permease [Thermoproteota archaeon]